MRVLSKKLFPKIKFILGNNALEPIGVKSHYFGEDLDVIKRKMVFENNELFHFFDFQLLS